MKEVKSTNDNFLNSEVVRLCKASDKGLVYPSLMSRDRKMELLAEGVITGWYGDEVVAGRILKGLYSEVMEKVKELSK